MLDSKLMDIKLSNRKKCIGEYNDIYHIFYPNFSKKYENYYKENESIFKKYKGRFSHLSDIACRNENILNLYNNSNEERKNKTNLKANKNKSNIDNINSNINISKNNELSSWFKNEKEKNNFEMIKKSLGKRSLDKKLNNKHLLF
jgi:hypothetical protein